MDETRAAAAPRQLPSPSAREGPAGRSPGGLGCGRLLGGLLLAAGGLLLALGALALFLAVAESRRLAERLAEPFSRPQPTAVFVSPTVIVQRLRGASELATAIATLETVVDASQDRTLGPFTIGRTRLLYVAHGQVRAGVDLAALGEGDVTVSGDTVTVRLPPPRILDQKIDVGRSRVFDVDQELLAPVAPELQSQTERQALAQIVAAACESDILGEANARAEAAVSALVAAVSPYTVRVLPSAPAADACPGTPTPPPDGTATP